MTGANHRLLTAAALALAVLPATAFAQAPNVTIDIDRVAFRRSLDRVEISGVTAPVTPIAPRAVSRGGKIALGAAIGAAAGLLIGEVWFGQQLDFPHGPDMLIGAAIFGGAGALIARGLVGSGSGAPPAAPKKTIAITPVLSKTTKAVVVRLSLK